MDLLSSSLRYFRTAVRAELGTRLQLDTTVGAVQLTGDLCPAIRAELHLASQRLAAARAGGTHAFAPFLFLEHSQVFLSHLGVSPDLLRGSAGLGGCHFHTQVGGALLA